MTGFADYIPTLLDNDSNKGYSQEYIKFMRDYAKQMAESKQKVYPYTWANGLADMSGKVLGAMMLKDVNNQERNSQRLKYGDMAGVNTPGAGGASGPGGAAPGAPFRVAALGPAGMSPPPQDQQPSPSQKDPSSPQAETNPRGMGDYQTETPGKGSAPTPTASLDTHHQDNGTRGPNRLFNTPNKKDPGADPSSGKEDFSKRVADTSKIVDDYRKGFTGKTGDDPVRLAGDPVSSSGKGRTPPTPPAPPPGSKTEAPRTSGFDPITGGLPIPQSPYSNNLPSGQMQRDLSDYYRNIGQHGYSISPEEIDKVISRRQELMPKYTPDPTTGLMRVDEPGKPPALVPNAPGSLPFLSPPRAIPGTPLEVQDERDATGRTTGRRMVPILPPKGGAAPAPSSPFSPSSGITPPTIPSPAVPSPPPSSGGLAAAGPGPLGTPAPGAIPVPPVAAASSPVSGTPPVSAVAGTSPARSDIPASPVVPTGSDPTKVAELTPEEFKKLADSTSKTVAALGTHGAVKPASPSEIKRLPTSNPPDAVWVPYLNAAASKPIPEVGANVPPPDVYDTDTNRMAAWTSRQKGYENTITEIGKKYTDTYSKLADNIHDTGFQSRKQMPAIKQQIQLMDNAQRMGLEQGPLAAPITTLKSLRQETGRIAEQLKASGYPVPEALTNWAHMDGGEANQVMVKNQSALTLENLRNMLGPNSGQFRVYELQLLNKALGGEEISPGAQKTVMNMVDRINDRTLLYDKMATSWEEKFGSLDPRFREAMIRFDQDHPAFSEDEFNRFMAESWDAPTVPWAPASPAGTPPASAPSGGWNDHPEGKGRWKRN